MVPEIPWLVRWGGWAWVALMPPFLALGLLVARRIGRRIDRARLANAVLAAEIVGEHPQSLMQAGLVPGRLSRRVRIEILVLGALAGHLVEFAALTCPGAVALASWNRTADSPLTPADCAAVASGGYGLDDPDLLVASFSPTHRTSALRRLEVRLRGAVAWCPHDDNLVERLVEVADLAGSCAAGTALDHRSYILAAKAGERCPDSVDAVDAAAAQIALGRFDLASRHVERADPERLALSGDFVVATHLLAGRTDVAVRAARELPAAARRLIHAGRGSGTPHELECLADAIEARRGDHAALESLAERASKIGPEACGTLLDWALAPLNPAEPDAAAAVRLRATAPMESVDADCCWRCPAFRPEPCVRRQRAAVDASGDRATVERLDRILQAYDRAHADESIAFPLDLLSLTGARR